MAPSSLFQVPIMNSVSFEPYPPLRFPGRSCDLRHDMGKPLSSLRRSLINDLVKIGQSLRLIRSQHKIIRKRAGLQDYLTFSQTDSIL